MQPWFTVYFGIGYPCYDQMTPVKTRYPLASITWPYRGLKLKAHRAQVFFWSWLLTRCCFLIGSRAGLFGKLVNAHPGLNINQIITFSSMQMFLLQILYIIGIHSMQGRALIRKRPQLEGNTKSNHYLGVQAHQTQGCRRCGAQC